MIPVGSQRAMSLTLFPFAQYWQYYAAFTVLVLALLVVDLGVFHRRRTPSPCAKPPSGAPSGSLWPCSSPAWSTALPTGA